MYYVLCMEKVLEKTDELSKIIIFYYFNYTNHFGRLWTIHIHVWFLQK